MGRSSRRKKGKAAKAARRGLLGITATSLAKKKSKIFEKRTEYRLNKKDRLKTDEILRENNLISRQPSELKPYHSFVIHTGKVGRHVRQLERDLRRLMSPHTSNELKVTKRNNFKDFLVNSQYLGVTHLLVLTRTSMSVNLRIIRNPQGPTLNFKVEKYSLIRDIVSSQKRPMVYEELFQHPPLLILNGFPSEGKKHLQLVQTIIRNMFPSIDVDQVKLATIRRALLLYYNAEDDLIEFRHYSIKAVPSGVSRSAKKLLQNKIPDLSKYEDISDFLLKPGQLSDSEFEGEQVEVDLPQDIGGRGKKKGQKTKLRLIEIGPRMNMRLVKIEEGINDGEVLYHAFVEKTSEEIALLRKMAPKIKKKRLRHEKEVEHSTIRKMRNQAEKDIRLAEMNDKQKECLIEQQREVTGNYSDEVKLGEGNIHEDEADDEKEIDDEKDKKDMRMTNRTNGAKNIKDEKNRKKGSVKDVKREKKGKGERFK